MFSFHKGAVAQFPVIFAMLLAPSTFAVAHKTTNSNHVYPPLPFASEYGGTFKLTAHDGKVVTQKDFNGKYFILYFGYTECSDTCPTALLTISRALQQLGSIGESITPLFVNLDEKRMSLEKLKKYVRYFHPRFIGMTGTAAQIRTAAAGYRIRYRAVIGKDGARSVVHSGKIFFIGPGGKVIAYYPHEAPPSWLVTSIRSRLKTGTDASLRQR